MSALRLALADDQALVRSGLRALLDALPGIEVVVEADDGAALLRGIAARPVDVVLADIRMPGMDGLTMLRELRAAADPTPVILLTTFDDDELPRAAAAAGAQGFLLKDASPEDLHEAILRVARGETLLAPVATDPLRERYAFRTDGAPAERFGEREVAILRLIAGGYSNREIARSVHLSEGTVKNYVSEILDKLDTRDRTRAVLKAIALRII
jgi:DNA-binding NarL/FixJ family response regulator